MSLVPPSPTSNHPPMPTGRIKARCHFMASVGRQAVDWQGEKKLQPKVVIGFMFPEHTHTFNDDAGPEPYYKSKTYTFSMHPKSALRRDLTAWRGKAFSDAEANSFDIATVLGTALEINIIEGDKEDARWIDSLMKIGNQADCPPLPNAPIEYSIDAHNADDFAQLPKWVQEMAMASIDWKAPGAAPSEPVATGGNIDPMAEDASDIPF